MGVNSAHTAAVSVISDFYPDGWGCEWQNASLRAGGQEATVTAGSGPGRGIHVIQENSKENVIMCQLQPTDTDRDEQNTEHSLTAVPIQYIQYNCGDCGVGWNGTIVKISIMRRSHWDEEVVKDQLSPSVWQRCGGARPCIRSASEWAARSERGLRASNAHHQAICHFINNKNKIFNTDFNKVKPCPIIKSPEHGLYNDFLNL